MRLRSDSQLASDGGRRQAGQARISLANEGDRRLETNQGTKSRRSPRSGGPQRLRQAALRAMDREASHSQAPEDLVGVVSEDASRSMRRPKAAGLAHGLINPKTLRSSASLRSLRWLSAYVSAPRCN